MYVFLSDCIRPEIEKITQKKISEIFVDDGEPAFRKIEVEVVDGFESIEGFVDAFCGEDDLAAHEKRSGGGGSGGGIRSIAALDPGCDVLELLGQAGNAIGREEQHIWMSQ